MVLVPAKALRCYPTQSENNVVGISFFKVLYVHYQRKGNISSWVMTEAKTILLYLPKFFHFLSMSNKNRQKWPKAFNCLRNSLQVTVLQSSKIEFRKGFLCRSCHSNSPDINNSIREVLPIYNCFLSIGANPIEPYQRIIWFYRSKKYLTTLVARLKQFNRNPLLEARKSFRLRKYLSQPYIRKFKILLHNMVQRLCFVGDLDPVGWGLRSTSLSLLRANSSK